MLLGAVSASALGAALSSALAAASALLAFAGQPVMPLSRALAPTLAPALAAPIIPPAGADDTCPNPRQVSDALQSHLPGLVQPAAAGRADALRAVLDIPSDGTVVHFSLVDARGDVQLRRSIPAPGRGRPATECVALAETLAEIVERYLNSVQYQASETAPPPPPTVVAPAPASAPPPGRAGFVFLGGALLMASSDNPSLFEGRVGGELELTHRPFALVARIDAGIAQQEDVTRAPKSASLRRFPLHAGLALELPAGPGTFEPCLTGGVEALLATSVDSATSRTDRAYRFTPVIGAETGYRVTLGRHLFVRPRASLGFAVVKYDIAVGGQRDVLFRTPSTYSTFGVDAGVVFR